MYNSSYAVDYVFYYPPEAHKSFHQPVSPTDGFPYQFRGANEVISVWLAGLNTALRIWEMM